MKLDVKFKITKTKKTDPHSWESRQRYAHNPLAAEHLQDYEEADWELHHFYYEIDFTVKRNNVYVYPRMLTGEKRKMTYAFLEFISDMVHNTEWAYIAFNDPRSIPQLMEFVTKLVVAIKRFGNIDYSIEYAMDDELSASLDGIVKAVEEAFQFEVKG